LERRRLLYVATTRARDHLVLSLHRCGGSQTNAQILAEAGAGTAAGAVAFSGFRPSAGAEPRSEARETQPATWAAWQDTVRHVRESARRSSAVSASGLEGTEPAVALAADPTDQAGRAKGARDLNLPPWSKGRYGSAVGRAVHGVLQSIDLATGVDLDGAVAAQCVAEGVTEHEDVVRGLVRSALESAVVRRAAARNHWRESYVGMRDEGIVLEGFADLVYRDDDGRLVVVDYKTDAIPAAAVDARTAFYAPQVQAYRRALSAATGARVDSVLLFLHPEQPAHAAHLPG
jgi:ATP-dependent exoDNAse (exonuclease V) beta subunit